MNLIVAETCKANMSAHAEATFPEECCGAMLGTEDEQGTRTIVEIVKAENTKGENRERRFLISPQFLMQTERYAKEQGLTVLGIYHSHPNHPSKASEFDRVHAMPFWSYLIVSCIEGETKTIQSWRLQEDRSAFDEETLTFQKL